MDRPDAGFGHEGAHLDVRRREQHHHRLSRRDPFAGAKEDVKDEPFPGSGLRLLARSHSAFASAAPRRSQVLLGGGDLVFAGTEPRGLEIGLGLGHSFDVLVASGAGADDIVFGTRSHAEDFLYADQLALRALEGRTHLVNLGFQ